MWAAGHATTTLSCTGLGGGTAYDVMTSTLADLQIQGAAGATCLADDVAATSFIDSQPKPAGGAGYYYLIRAQNVCGNGGYGSDSFGKPADARGALSLDGGRKRSK